MKNFKIVAVSALALGLISGCGPVREVRLDSMQEVLRKQGGSVNKNIGANLHEVGKDLFHNSELSEKEQRVLYLEEAIKALGFVETANVVIIENAAIVSVNFKGDMDGELLPRLKKEVKARVRELDKTLRYVSVTASPEILDKLYDITEEGNGHGNGAHERSELTRLRPQL